MVDVPNQLRIVINGRQDLVGVDETVAELLAHLDIPERGCAVAINAEVLPRSLWVTTVIKENDEIEVLTATPGG